MQYHWPGNVRELENSIERAVLLCDDHVIHSYHLPPTLQTAEETGTQQSQSLKDATERFERAARALQTTERIFGYKVKKYNIDARHYR